MIYHGHFSLDNIQVSIQRCSVLQSFTGNLNCEKLSQILSLLDHLHICAGQPDEHFVKMVVAKKGKILSPNGKVVAAVDKSPVELNGTFYSQTVRTSECEVLTNVHLVEITEQIFIQCIIGGVQNSPLTQAMILQVTPVSTPMKDI